MTSFIFSAIRKAIARVASVSLLDISHNIEPSTLRLRAITSSACEVPRVRGKQVSTAASSIPATLPSPSITPSQVAAPVHIQLRAVPAPSAYSSSITFRAARRPSSIPNIESPKPFVHNETVKPFIHKPNRRLNMRASITGNSENTRVFRGASDMGMAFVRVASAGPSFRRPMLKHVAKSMSHIGFAPTQFDRRAAPARRLIPCSSMGIAASAQCNNDILSATSSALKTAVFGSNENRRVCKALDVGLATARVATATMSFRSPAMKFATKVLLHPRCLPNHLDRRRAIVQRFLQERR